MAKRKAQSWLDGGRAMETADTLLAQIRTFQALHDDLAGRMAGEIRTIEDAYALRLGNLKENVSDAEKILKKLMKKFRSDLFGKRDRIDLEHGALLCTDSTPVKRLRDMLARLDAIRCSRLVKTARSVDWDAIEKLPDEELALLGTGRKKKTEYAYEVKK